MNPLNGKWALITGSSRGIGQQIAIGLAEKGCNIILHATRAENCDNTLEKINHFNTESLVVGGVLGDPKEEQKIIDRVLDKVGYIDILYNNAAVMSSWHDHMSEIPMKEWVEIYQINFFSLVRLCNAFYPIMVERNWGRIINLITGMENTPQLIPYSASKASVEKYTNELAAELKQTKVRVNALDPGWLKTDMGGENAPRTLEEGAAGILWLATGESGKLSGGYFRDKECIPW